MKTTNETYTESNYSSFIKDSNQKNSYNYSPFLKFNENLYNKCQSKFTEYASNKKKDLKLMINSQTKEKISIKDFFENSSNDISKLTPIPFINKRKIKNEEEKKELKNLERNVVLMRRLEYANKIKENNLRKKYNNKIAHIIFIQKVTRGYLVRKVIYQVGIINDSLRKFFYLIKLCVQKKYFYIFRYNISQIWVKNDIGMETDEENIKMNKNNFKEKEYDENDEKTLDIGKSNNYIINENEIQNDYDNKNEIDVNSFINLNLENENDLNNNLTRKSMQFINEQLNKLKNHKDEDNDIKNNKIEDNENYIYFTGKTSEKNEQRNNNNMFENYINASSNQNLIKLQFSNKIPSINIYKAKIIFIQRYFRKFLFQKEFYGKYGTKKIGFFLLKNIVINKLEAYAFNILKILYKNSINDITQEEDFLQLDSERIEDVKQKYNSALECISLK